MDIFKNYQITDKYIKVNIFGVNVEVLFRCMRILLYFGFNKSKWCSLKNFSKTWDDWLWLIACWLSSYCFRTGFSLMQCPAVLAHCFRLVQNMLSNLWVLCAVINKYNWELYRLYQFPWIYQITTSDTDRLHQ